MKIPLSIRRAVHIAFLMMAILLGAFAALRIHKIPLVEIPFPDNYPLEIENLKHGFEQGDTPSNRDYESLFHYFLEGYLYYKSPLGARVDYPGLPSKHGRQVDQLEGFSRLAPLLAAWLYSGRPDRVTLHNGAVINLSHLLRGALLAGTDPRSPEYWGGIEAAIDQRIVEAADIALVLWLTRDHIWETLAIEEQQQLASWLVRVNEQKIPDNNWHLFVVLVNAVLRDLDRPEGNTEKIDEHYARHKQFYREKGWYTDGERDGERFDYYNAWAIHYSLYWIDKIVPDLDHDFIHTSFGEYLSNYKYFFGVQGFPVMGRSTCYRMAAPAPLVLGYRDHASSVTAGEVRRALDGVWSYFIQRRAVKAGTVTQGYCDADPKILDDYSGQGSCLWSLRSLVAAFTLPETEALWRGMPAPLPVERASYRIDLLPVYQKIEGDKASGSIKLFPVSPSVSDELRLMFYRWTDRLWARLTHRIQRTKNKAAGYNASHYSSQEPYCGCP